MINIQTIQNLIQENIDSVLISYIDENGFPVTKAMLAPRRVEGVKTIYFATNTSSNKVASYKKNCFASIYFLDKIHFRGISLIGKCEVLTDVETKKEFWLDTDTQYFKEGVKDPDYCILKFTITHGRLYTGYSNEDFLVEN